MLKKLEILFHSCTYTLLQEAKKIVHGHYLYGLLKVKITTKVALRNMDRKSKEVL